MKHCALMLVLVLASTASADELAPRTRALLHEALEARLTLPADAPSLQRPVLPPSASAPSASSAAARESRSAANRAAQSATANKVAQDVANGKGRNNGPSDSARNAAGQAREVEARATGGNGASSGNPHGGPPGQNKGGKKN
jgi:hypothetical protein